MRRIEVWFGKADVEEHIPKLKAVTGERTTVGVIRKALRILWVLVQEVAAGKDLILVRRDNPKEKIRLALF